MIIEKVTAYNKRQKSFYNRFYYDKGKDGNYIEYKHGFVVSSDDDRRHCYARTKKDAIKLFYNH